MFSWVALNGLLEGKGVLEWTELLRFVVAWLDNIPSVALELCDKAMLLSAIFGKGSKLPKKSFGKA